MARQDQNGWGDAPGGARWACPECEMWTPIADWAIAVLSDDVYADEDARQCPHCKTLVPKSDGSAAIAATIEQLTDTPAAWPRDVPVMGGVSSGAPAPIKRD